MPRLSRIPRGSVLKPILFNAYTSPISLLIKSYNIQCRQFADDTQLFVALYAVNSSQTVSRLSERTAAVKQWFLCNEPLAPVLQLS